jgi:2-polyprenyl-3-methyl-5-hydroxy-6-metoxy-1,4-benzoquinol methylase
VDSKTKWNSKYKERLDQWNEPVVNPRLLNLAASLHGGRALDIACGLGANSLFLALLNYQVEAMDISDVAINFVHEQARRNQLSIHPLVCDLTELETINWVKNSFNLVVMTYYLDRTLFPVVKSLIQQDGYFFMETFYQTSKKQQEGVSSQYKLQSNELLSEFSDWKIVFFEENEQEGRQTIFCQKIVI